MLTALAYGFVATLIVTAMTWRLVVKRRIVAIPNERSSHQIPTPSLGGIGFVLPILGWLVAVQFHADLRTDSGIDVPVVFFWGGLTLGVLGLIDDLIEVSAALRLAVHLVVAAGAVVSLFVEPVWLMIVLVIGLAWFVNLYNFMDGIDGIAASQVVTYCMGVLMLADRGASSALAAILIAASMGFLCFNWAPARIFMGDVGSGFLGFVMGLFVLVLADSGELPIIASVILLVAFWFDASYTLSVRIVTRQPFIQAHRSHLYQKVAKRIGHGRTTLVFWIHNLLWLLPLAGAAVRYPQHELWLLGMGCLPMLLACGYFRAGVPEQMLDEVTDGAA